METQIRNGATDIHDRKYNVLSLDSCYSTSLLKFTMQMKKGVFLYMSQHLVALEAYSDHGSELSHTKHGGGDKGELIASCSSRLGGKKKNLCLTRNQISLCISHPVLLWVTSMVNHE
jgi:hypothetical protein